MNNREEYILLKCLEVHQPLGDFFIGSMLASDLVYISYADIRELEDKSGELDRYMGIQRQLSPSRVKDLKKYVTMSDATFPTGIILAIDSVEKNGDKSGNEKEVKQLIEYNPAKFEMKILRDENVAKIIDGQHRIKGLEGLDNQNFEVNVAIFVDMDIEDQAMVFATINLKQTKVSKSLAYDLFEYARKRSPQKTCHNIARLMHSRDGSPFEGKVKVLGRADGPNQTLTQAAFVDRLLDFLSPDPMKDRDTLRNDSQPKRADEKSALRYIFRNLFLDEQDAVIARIIWDYFVAVRKKWPKAWDNVVRGNILNRTTGFAALMKFLRPAYLSATRDKRGLVSSDEFSKIFRRIDIKDETFTPEAYKPGSSGQSALFHALMDKSGLSESK